jgi:hypothetical protein
VDHEAFINSLLKRFPEVDAAISDYARGLLHCEVADFLRVVEAAMDSGKDDRVGEYLAFVDECRRVADPDLINAIDASFLENFALGDHTIARQRAVRERMPTLLRRRIIEVDNRWG